MTPVSIQPYMRPLSLTTPSADRVWKHFCQQSARTSAAMSPYPQFFSDLALLLFGSCLALPSCARCLTLSAIQLPAPEATTLPLAVRGHFSHVGNVVFVVFFWVLLWVLLQYFNDLTSTESRQSVIVFSFTSRSKQVHAKLRLTSRDQHSLRSRHPCSSRQTRSFPP